MHPRPSLIRQTYRRLTHTGVDVGRSMRCVLAIGLSLFVTACADEGLPPAPSVGESLLGGLDRGEVVGLGCVAGTTEPCSVTLGEHGGVVSCYEGIRRCEDGRFSACQEGHGFDLARGDIAAASGVAGLHSLAFGAATDCLNNPCNRYCREFEEVPEDGLSADLDLLTPPPPPWQEGSLEDYPPEWTVVGISEPCQMAEDCQFNTTCSDPSPGTCSHSVCTGGDVLAPGCSRCADTVCAVDSDCCGTPVVCAHDPCSTTSVAKLDPACDSCVAAVCAVNSACCTTAWTQACVDLVASECAPLGQSCGCPSGSIESGDKCYLGGGVARNFGLARDACSLQGGGWSLAQIDDATENDIAGSLIGAGGLGSGWVGGVATGPNQWLWQASAEVFFDSNNGGLQPGYTFEGWGAGEPQADLDFSMGGYGIALDASGRWRDERLSSARDYVCEGPPNALGPRLPTFTWDDSCRALAESECGVQCPQAPDIPLGLAACTAREATRLDPQCPGFDLALGATCEDAGIAQIPVCNHGQSQAPVGLRLTHVPADQIGVSPPDLSDATDCTLAEPIPAGRCVVVTDCPGLTPDRALVINPEDGAENTSECRLDDNWTLYQPVACQDPTCEASVHDAARVAGLGCGIPVENPLTIDAVRARVVMDTVAPEPSCGPGEVRWGNSCYFFSATAETWNVAADRCRNRGAGWELIALNSEAENDWARSMTDTSQDVQIGFNDKLLEGDHHWSNGTCRQWINWDSGQPNNSPPGSQQCARMTLNSFDAWEDKECNDGQHPYVCEGPIQNAQGNCDSGQITGPDGACYAYDTTGATHADAEASCLSMGPGWALVQINDETSNDFVSALSNCTPTWLNASPGSYQPWAPAESIDLSLEPSMGPLGFWHTTADSTLRATLCQGPTAPPPSPTLTQVSGPSACTAGNQYYFEGSSVAPETLMLCPDTCTLASAIPGRRLDVDIPCAPPPPPAIETVVDGLYYTADCEGGGAIWDFFYYDSVTPADSQISFELRAAPSIADLSSASFISIADAHAIPDNTQRCEVNPPSCPIDIFTLLGSPAQQQEVLELRVTLTPGSNGEGPLLRDWKVRFSCPPSQ